MFKFISGVTMGIYLGTYYDLKPKIIEIHKFIKKNLPKEK